MRGNMEEVKICDPSIIPQCHDQTGNPLKQVSLLFETKPNRRSVNDGALSASQMLHIHTRMLRQKTTQTCLQKMTIV